MRAATLLPTLLLPTMLLPIGLLPTVWGADRLPAVAGLIVLGVGTLVTIVRARPPAKLAIGLGTLLVATIASLGVSGWPWQHTWPRAALLLWTLALVAALAHPRAHAAPSAGPSSTMWRTRLAFVALAGIGLASPWIIDGSNERAAVVAMALAAMLGHALAVMTDGSTRTMPARFRSASMTVIPIALLVGILFRAESRGGWLAALVGIGVVVWRRWGVGVSGIGRERRRRVLLYGVALLVLLALAALGTARGGALAGRILSDGSPQGLAFDAATHGRPVIWRRAVRMITDAPFTGRGLGTFDTLRHAVYPLGFARDVELEDAHQFVLQTWLDLGPIGLVGWLWVLVATGWHARHVTQARHRSAGASANVGLVDGALGAVVAFLVFGLADAVALGMPGSIAFWLAIGLIWAHRGRPRIDRGRAPGPRMRGTVGGSIALLSVVSVVVLRTTVDIGSTWRRNASTLEADRALASVDRLASSAQIEHALTRLRGLAAERCATRWLEGWLAAEVEGASGRRNAWQQHLDCSPHDVGMMAIAAAGDGELAQYAVARWPGSAAAWAWWAGSFGLEPTDGDRVSALRIWRRSLGLGPENGPGWRRLGDLLVQDDQLVAALDAYAASCHHGDPGANGCWLAGQLAEHLGRPSEAAAFYARSRWSGAAARRTVLESVTTSGSVRP